MNSERPAARARMLGAKVYVHTHHVNSNPLAEISRQTIA
jgi:hypothetical protein